MTRIIGNINNSDDDDSSGNCCHVDQDRPSFFIPGITGKARCLSTSNTATGTGRPKKSASSTTTTRFTKSASESHCMNQRSTTTTSTRFAATTATATSTTASPYSKTQSDSALSNKTLLEFRAQRRKSSTRSAPDRLSATKNDDETLDMAQNLHDCILGTILEKHNRLLQHNVNVWNKSESVLDLPLTCTQLDGKRDTTRAATAATATNTPATADKPKRRKSARPPNKSSPVTPRATKSSLKKKTKESPTAVHQLHEEQHKAAPNSFLPQHLLDKNKNSHSSFQPFGMDDAFLPLADNFPPPPPLLGTSPSWTSEDTTMLSKPLQMEQFDGRLDASLLRLDTMQLKAKGKDSTTRTAQVRYSKRNAVLGR